MYLLIFVAFGMAAVMFEAARRRPRLPLFVAGVLWLLYAFYEYLVDTGVLCDDKCDIRVDLLLFGPILYVASHYAYVAYNRPHEQHTIVGMVLGAFGLVVLALLMAAFGYLGLGVFAGLGALLISAYAIRTRWNMK